MSTKEKPPETVAVVGASPVKDRYSNKAVNMLQEYGHTPLPVAPKHKQIEGHTVFPSLKNIKTPVDTVTLYLDPKRQEPVIEHLIQMLPKRVIFNPGAENPAVYERLKSAGIKPVEACTLVLLRTHQF